MNLEWIKLPGISAGVLTASSRVPQIVKTWKTRSAGGLSLRLYVLLCVGFLLWLTYGLLTDAIPVILYNVVSLAFNATLLGFRLWFGAQQAP